MGPLLGVFTHKAQSYSYRGDPEMKGPGYLASNPIVSSEEWEQIVDYYTATSPAQLPPQDRTEKISMKLDRFRVVEPELHYKDAHSCFVQVRTDSIAALIVSDAVTLETYFLNGDLVPVDSLKASGPLVDISFAGENTAVACNVGLINPNDDALGSAVLMQQRAGKWEIESTDLFDGLHRPTQVLPADLNMDGNLDYLVCEFGYMQGGLSWMEKKADGHYEKHSISKLPGAQKAYVLDYNRDNKPDIMAMFAQGEEGIFLYLNAGDGTFEEKILLQFPAAYGSSHFELADFNNDGLEDILYTAGDNADYTSILKPYHGVYIFLNKGEDRFEQAYFFPIDGCYKAMASDFDKDGDLDLATIAYYADFRSQPEEGFVFLENKGNLQFSPSSAVQLNGGRWITMDIGDVDQDGWVDIVLGNFVQPSKFSNPEINWTEAAPIMILKNVGG